MDKFWMVLIDGTESCRYKHPTFESARIEAERLLNKTGNFGNGATILEAVEYGKIKLNPIEWAKIDQIVGYEGREIER
jgi:hypothetical protein